MSAEVQPLPTGFPAAPEASVPWAALMVWSETPGQIERGTLQSKRISTRRGPCAQQDPLHFRLHIVDDRAVGDLLNALDDADAVGHRRGTGLAQLPTGYTAAPEAGVLRAALRVWSKTSGELANPSASRPEGTGRTSRTAGVRAQGKGPPLFELHIAEDRAVGDLLSVLDDADVVGHRRRTGLPKCQRACPQRLKLAYPGLP